MTGDHEGDLELQALMRQLDDAFETTRPRAGFEDELWQRVQAGRPVWVRLRDAVGGLAGGIRAVPAVPGAAVAALLVVVIAAGVIGLNSGLIRPGSNSSATGAMSADNGLFGRVPAPSLGASSSSAVRVFTPNAPLPAVEAGGATGASLQIVWAGPQSWTLTSAPVYRYQEPTAADADRFARSLGAALIGRPQGFLGSYQAADYTLRIRGTVQSSPQTPPDYIVSASTMPSIAAAGAAPGDIAALFLAEHNLTPDWSYTVAVGPGTSPLEVVFQRQFAVPDYGPAYLVDAAGTPYGLEVDLNGASPEMATGPLPVSLDVAVYPLITFDAAVQRATGAGFAGGQWPGSAGPAATAPTLKLDQVELAYVLVAAGDRSFYEPVFLFSGKGAVNGSSVVLRVLVPALA